MRDMLGSTAQAPFGRDTNGNSNRVQARGPTAKVIRPRIRNAWAFRRRHPGHSVATIDANDARLRRLSQIL